MCRTLGLVMLVVTHLSAAVEGADRVGLPGSLGPLPSSHTVLGANLVRDGKWYVLDAAEISAITESMSAKPFTVPRGKEVVMPATDSTIVLWGIKGQAMVPLDVVDMDGAAFFLSSDAKSANYSVAGTARTRLRELIKRIREGKQRPVAVTSKEEKEEGGIRSDSKDMGR
jgi:hypothetical protein